MLEIFSILYIQTDKIMPYFSGSQSIVLKKTRNFINYVITHTPNEIRKERRATIRMRCCNAFYRRVILLFRIIAACKLNLELELTVKGDELISLSRCKFY